MSYFEGLFLLSKDFPRAVQEVVVEHCVESRPSLLLPYSLLRGSSAVRFMHDLPSGVRCFELPEPDLCRNFGRAVALLERCVQFVDCARSVTFSVGSLPPGGSVSCVEFFVAGGFVVSEIFGFGPFGDVDVFFSGSSADSSPCCAVPRSCVCDGVRISAIRTSCPYYCIETFDLPICQAAIRCRHHGSEREYQLLMSSACVKAFLMRCCLTSVVPRGLAQVRRLEARVFKYVCRGLRCLPHHFPGYRQCSFRDTYVELLCDRPVLEGCPVFPGWVLTFDGDRIASVVLGELVCSGASRIAVCDRVCSRAVLLSPCRGGDLSGWVRDPACVSSWLPRVVRSGTCLVAIPGVGRVWSNFVVPAYLFDLLHLGEASAVRHLRSALPPFANNPDARVLFGDFSLHVLALRPDWNVLREVADSAYWPSRMLVMIRNSGYCVERKTICVRSGCLCDASLTDHVCW